MMPKLIMISVAVLTFTLGAVQASPDTILYIEPSSIIDPTLTPGSTFTADVMISDVEYLWAWQFNVSFDPTVLRIADLIEGDFLKGQPEGTYFQNVTWNDKGIALIGCATLGTYIGVSGSGTLVTVEFQVLAVGGSFIEFHTEPIDGFYPTVLVQQLSAGAIPNWNYLCPPDDFTTQDGYFNNIDPTEALQGLIATIDSWNLHRGTENVLKAALRVASSMLEMGQEDAAIRRLTVFISQVERLREKTLTNEQADYLTSEVQRIIDLIDG